MRTTNLFVNANVKQLRTGGSFRILLPFFRTSWGVGFLNSVIFNIFHNRVDFGTILEGLRNFGGEEGWTPPQYPTVKVQGPVTWKWQIHLIRKLEICGALGLYRNVTVNEHRIVRALYLLSSTSADIQPVTFNLIFPTEVLLGVNLYSFLKRFLPILISSWVLYIVRSLLCNICHLRCVPSIKFLSLSIYFLISASRNSSYFQEKNHNFFLTVLHNFWPVIILAPLEMSVQVICTPALALVISIVARGTTWIIAS